MKRFFCRVCGKVKRVRVLPDDVEHANSKDVEARVGSCRFHAEVNAVTTRDQVNHRGRVAHVNLRRHKAPVVVATPKKDKRGRRDKRAA